ncbi:hypothetical protein C1752_00984 [Acaryochloris thomasi RCC1774]|uniref:Uncharacterized protein n=1 Tax=Acaryochloris thomasi RCC1774 TaxID=1764569 RepID=A0A2W1JNC7_9CYAN|nr:hypothetical protein [Acaryochloris thomasi]PZD74840.1 hypothetical protein C1752_00984 [Acaryochloris thomasi RCC1774]
MIKKNRLRLLISFGAGFISVLLLHQGVLALLNRVEFIPVSPYSLKSTQPLGIPQVFSSAFWGGLWGIALSLFGSRIKGNTRYWVTTLLFGAFAPTAVFLFVVLPLKGLPIAGGWQPNLIATGLMVNGAWGLGVASVIRWLSREGGRDKEARSV